MKHYQNAVLFPRMEEGHSGKENGILIMLQIFHFCKKSIEVTSSSFPPSSTNILATFFPSIISSSIRVCYQLIRYTATQRVEAFSKTAYSKEIKMCLEDYYKKGKVHHLLITEAAQATGLYSILCMILLVWCYFRLMAEWCNVHIAKKWQHLSNLQALYKCHYCDDNSSMRI